MLMKRYIHMSKKKKKITYTRKKTPRKRWPLHFVVFAIKCCHHSWMSRLYQVVTSGISNLKTGCQPKRENRVCLAT